MERRLYELRKSRGIKQKTLVNLLGVGYGSYSRYETGKSEPSVDKLCLLADFYGVSVDYLLGRGNPVAQYVSTGYPGNLTDAQWDVIARFFPQNGNNDYSRRSLLDAVFYLSRTRCSWRCLPHDFPPWTAVRKFYHDACASGLWARILQAVTDEIGFSPATGDVQCDVENISQIAQLYSLLRRYYRRGARLKNNAKKAP